HAPPRFLSDPGAGPTGPPDPWHPARGAARAAGRARPRGYPRQQIRGGRRDPAGAISAYPPVVAGGSPRAPALPSARPPPHPPPPPGGRPPPAAGIPARSGAPPATVATAFGEPTTSTISSSRSTTTPAPGWQAGAAPCSCMWRGPTDRRPRAAWRWRRTTCDV